MNERRKAAAAEAASKFSEDLSAGAGDLVLPDVRKPDEVRAARDRGCNRGVLAALQRHQ